MTPLPPVDRDVLARAMTLAERSNWEPDPAKAAALREAARELLTGIAAPPSTGGR